LSAALSLAPDFVLRRVEVRVGVRATFVESAGDESDPAREPVALSARELSAAGVVPVDDAESRLAFARSRVGVTARVQFAGSVAQRSGTMLARTGGVVSAAVAFVAVSWALPAFSQEKAPSAVSPTAAATEAARRFLSIMVDSGVRRVQVGDRSRITTI
jgi:hypothetical protein